MDKLEAAKFLALIVVAYPTAYRNIDDITRDATVNMWQREFSSTPYVIMEMALDNFKRVSKFPPTVAEIYEELRQLYYTALEDSFKVRFNKNKELEAKSRYIMLYTQRFKGTAFERQIDYLGIGNHIAALPEGGEDYG